MLELIAQNMAPIMFVSLILFLLFGYPVAFALAANGLLFFIVGVELAPLSNGNINLSWELLRAIPDRFFGGVVANEVLLAVPFFTFMGIVLEKSGMAEDLLDTIGQLFGPVRGGLAYAVIIVGALLAATTGVVAASVIAMGLISLPIMLRYGYDRKLASGTIAASGTLAQIIPPSLVLIVLADQLGRSVGDMYKGALIPGLVLTGLYMVYIFVTSIFQPHKVPALPPEARKLGSGVKSLLAVLLIAGLAGYLTFHYLHPKMGVNADIYAGTVGVLVAYFIALLDKEGWRFLVKLAIAGLACAIFYGVFVSHVFGHIATAILSVEGMGALIFSLICSAIVGIIAFALIFKVVATVIDFTYQPEHSLGLTSRLAQQVIIVLIPPLALIFLVLGTIFLGIATPTEGGAMGAVGSLILAGFKKRLNYEVISQALAATTRLSAFVMFILIGARVFSLTFYGVNGHVWVEHLLTSLPGGEYGFLIAVSVLVFLLAFFLDFFELAFIIVPLLAPAAESLGIDLIWFGVILGVNMQTSFMHPPFGFALFYLRSVAPKLPYRDKVTGKTMEPVRSSQIYWGAVPYVLIQIVMVGVVIAFPNLVMHYKGAPVDTSNVQIQIPESGLGGSGSGSGFGTLGGLGGSPFGQAPAGGTETPATEGTSGGFGDLGGPPNFGTPGEQPAPQPATPEATPEPEANGGGLGLGSSPPPGLGGSN
ncbi:TRAP transporter large permease [Paracoccus caeni]|uniref:TRAP transporter large permease n=1 Tax=Paracoccus caeni TaxID=657651 RepID=UPI002D7FB7E5|nr:TRAP transporter large permease subunit [Paracoccus caeni]